MTTLVTTPEPGLDTIVERMARREVAAHFLVPLDQAPGEIRPPAPPIAMLIMTCPACGADATTFHASGIALPFAEWSAVPAEAAAGGGAPTLTVLGCEWFAPRALLPVALAVERYGPGRATGFRSRAVALTELAGRPLDAALAVLDRQESWTGDLTAGDLTGSPLRTVPAATREVAGPGAWPAYAGLLTPRFLGPHGRDAELDRLNDVYLEVRRSAAARALLEDAACPA